MSARARRLDSPAGPTPLVSGLIGLGCAMFALAWVLPGHYVPWTSFWQDLLAACAALVIVLAALLPAGVWPARAPTLAWLALVMAAVPLLQWAGGQILFLSDAVLSAAYLSAFALAAVAGQQLRRSGAPLVPWLLASCLLAALLSLVIGTTQWFGAWWPGVIELVPRGGRVFANLSQPNQLAGLLGLGVAAVAWAYERERVRAPLAIAAVVLLCQGLVMTQSRVAWGFLPLFLGGWALYRGRLGLRSRPAAVLGLGLAYVLLIFAWAPLNEALHLGVSDLAVAERLQQGHRALHWRVLGDALLRSPWLGYGWQQVVLAQQAAALDHPPSFEWLSASHSQVLDLLIWNGIPLGLAFIALLAWWGIGVLRRCQDVESWALLLALGVFAVHSLVEFPLHYAYDLLPAGLMAGALETGAAPAARSRLQPVIGRAFFALAVAMMTALLAIIVDEYIVTTEAVHRLQWREQHPRNAPPTFVPNVFLLDGPRDYVRAWQRTPDRMSPADLGWMRAVVQRSPTPGLLQRYAVLAGLNGQPQEAAHSLALVCSIASREQCELGRRAWQEYARRWPQLAAIPYPPPPPP